MRSTLPTLPGRRCLLLCVMALGLPVARAEESPQHWRDVAAAKHAAAVAALIASGADLNAQDATGLTALHRAASEDVPAAVSALLAAGARHDIRNRRGDTALHHAGPLSQALLLATGADAKARNGRGRLPLHTVRGAAPALRGGDIDARDLFGMTPLHVAAFEGDDEKVAWLLQQGADPQLRSTAVFDLAAQPGWTDWEPRHRFEAGQRPLDLARWQHDSAKWSTGRYRRTVELLDAATPWRMPWR